MSSLFRILIFLKSNKRASWQQNRLRQREFEADGAIVWNHYTGQLPRYPLRNSDLFHKDWFRFIDCHENAIGDVYVNFNLHETLVTDTLYVIPNEKSGGLDFTRDEKIKESIVRGEIEEKAELRWFPLPSPQQLLVLQINSVKTYLVIHHPEDVCKIINPVHGRPIPTGQFLVIRHPFNLYLATCD